MKNMSAIAIAYFIACLVIIFDLKPAQAHLFRTHRHRQMNKKTTQQLDRLLKDHGFIPIICTNEKGIITNPKCIFANIPRIQTKTWWGDPSEKQETNAFLKEENAEYYISTEDPTHIQDAKYWGTVHVTKTTIISRNGNPRVITTIQRIPKVSQTSTKNVNSPFGPTK